MKNPYLTLPSISHALNAYALSELETIVAKRQSKVAVSQYILTELEQGIIEHSHVVHLAEFPYQSIGLAQLETLATTNRANVITVPKKCIKPKTISRKLSAYVDGNSESAEQLIYLIEHTELFDMDDLSSCVIGGIEFLDTAHKYIDARCNVILNQGIKSQSIFHHLFGFMFNNNETMAIYSTESVIVNVVAIIQALDDDYAYKQILNQTLHIMSSYYGIFIMPHDYMGNETPWTEQAETEFDEISQQLGHPTIEQMVQGFFEDEKLMEGSEVFGQYGIDDADELLKAFQRVQFGRTINDIDWMQLPNHFFSHKERSIKNVARLLATTAPKTDTAKELRDICCKALNILQRDAEGIRNRALQFEVPEEQESLCHSVFIKYDNCDGAEVFASEHERFHYECGTANVEELALDANPSHYQKIMPRLIDINQCLQTLHQLHELNKQCAEHEQLGA